MYQPKWLGVPEKLRAVAQAAVVAAAEWSPEERVRTAIALRRGGLREMSDKVLQNPDERREVDDAFRGR